MKAIKRTVAAILATLMLATSTSFVFAADEYNYSDVEAVAVAKVNAAEIMTGTDLGFEPTKTLTRAEAAAIMVRLKGIAESSVTTAKGTTIFTDVPADHWASGYINVATTLGIINGIGNGLFAPDKVVTIAEFETMAVRAIGAGQLVDSQGVWPENYVTFANEEGINDDVYAIYTADATRINAAIIIANLLKTPMWVKSQVTTNKEITWVKTEGEYVQTILEDVLGLEESYGEVTSVSLKDHKINGNVDVDEDFDLSTIKVGLKYHGYYDPEEKVIKGLWIEDESVEFTAVKDKYNSSKNEIKLLVDGKEKTYKVAQNAKVYINENNVKPGQAIAYYTFNDIIKSDSLFGSIVLNDKNEIEAIYIIAYINYGIVKELTKTTIKFDNKLEVCDGITTPISLKYNDEDKDYFFTKDGKAFDLARLEKGDAIAYYEADDKYVGIVLNPVEGKISSIGSDYAKVDGKKYEVLNAFDDFANVGDEVKLYIDNGNKIVGYVEVEKEKEDVAYVTYMREVVGKYGHNYEIQLLFTDGTKSEKLTVDLEATADAMIDDAEDGKFAYANHLYVDENSDGDCDYCDGLHTYIDRDPEDNECDICLLAEAAHTGASHTDYCEAYIEDTASTSQKEAAVREYLNCQAFNSIAFGEGKFYGRLIGYEINGDKVTLSQPDFDDYEYINDSLKVGSKTITVDGFYLTEDTKVFKLRADDEYGLKTEEVKVEDLDDMPAVTGYVYGIDDKTNEVDVLFIDIFTGIKRTSETNFVFITDVADTKYNDKNAKEITGYDMDGEEVSYIYCEDYADATIASGTLTVGKVIDAVVSGDLLVDVVTHNTEDDNLTQLSASVGADDILDTRIKLHDGTTLLLADKVLVLELEDDEELEFTVSSLDEIEEYDSDADKNDCIQYVTFEDDVETAAIVILFYEGGN